MRAHKDAAYSAFAEVTKALASPRRLELLDLLLQRPHTVEALAEALGQSVGNTSQHLQVLRRARVVETERHGTSITYRLAPGVEPVFVALRELAAHRSAEVAAAHRRLQGDPADAIDLETVATGLAQGELLLLDVRPRDEFAHGHVDGAVCLPLTELDLHLDDLPRDRLIVATCRGPTCTYAGQAVVRIRATGRRAARFELGVGEWRSAGGSVVAA